MRSAIRHGIRFSLDISDVVQWYLYWGLHEPSHETFVMLAREGMVVIDVGANIGLVTLRCAQRVGECGAVIAIEPSSENLALLRHHVALNDADNVEVVPFALSDVPGEVRIVVRDPNNRGMNAVSESGSGPLVRATTVDDLTRSLERVDLIKIDVEGFEVNVLRGAVQTLELHRPTMLIEVSEQLLAQHGTSAAELVHLLASAGYEARHPVTHMVMSERELACGHHDVLCTPREPPT